MAIIEGKRAFLYKVLPIDSYLKIIYKKYHGKTLDLNDPKRFTEKLFWLKKYNMTVQKDLLVKCYDKYTAREYVEKKIGSEYLTKLYALYDGPDNIRFDELPDKYVMKITQSSGSNVIHNKGCEFTDEEIREMMRTWQTEIDDLDTVNWNTREEGYYFNGNSKILCEECLETEDGKIPDDIRFFCFNGKPMFYCVDFDTVDEKGIKKHDFYYRNAYTIDGEFIRASIGRPFNDSLERPQFKNFDTMVEIAHTLSEDFPFVRVDLYNVDGRIVFGELTWMPQGGNMPVEPEEFDLKLGSELKLPTL